MPRDIFAGTFERKATAPKSGWTIAGSFVAHVVLLGALVVVPLVSALDSYVVEARNFVLIAPPPPSIPATPVAPPQSAAPPPSDIRNIAPSHPPQGTVIRDFSPVVANPGPPGAPPIADARAYVLGPGGGDGIVLPPPPPPVVPKPIRPGGDVSPPKRLTHVDPIYPPIAVAAKIDGMVILEATIDETGVVRDVKVLRSIPMLDQAAIDAVKRWRYTPTKLNGVPVPILLTVTVTFSVR